MKKIAYYSKVRGTGFPILLLHGFTGSLQNWEELRLHIEKQYLFAATDIVGHGGSESPPDIEYYNMKHQAENLIQFIEAVGYSNFNLLGYSMGGRLALYMATHYSDKIKSLILESASPGLKTEAERETRRKSDNALADKIEANGIEWFVDYWENISLWETQTPEHKAKLREGRLRNDPVGLANSLRGMGTGVMPSLWDKLPELEISVKLIAGELDTKYVNINREMAELIPNADISIVDGAGHTVHFEKPDTYSDIVLQFLSKHS